MLTLVPPMYQPGSRVSPRTDDVSARRSAGGQEPADHTDHRGKDNARRVRSVDSRLLMLPTLPGCVLAPQARGAPRSLRRLRRTLVELQVALPPFFPNLDVRKAAAAPVSAMYLILGIDAERRQGLADLGRRTPALDPRVQTRLLGCAPIPLARSCFLQDLR